MRKSLALLVATASLSGVGALVPAAANAATSGSTNLTFTVNSGGLSISAPGSLTLQSGGSALTLGQASGSVTGTLSAVTVTDSRGGLALNGWKDDLGTMSGFTGYDLSTGSTPVSGASIAASNGNVTASAASLTNLTGANLVTPTVNGVTMDTGGTITKAPASPSLTNSYSASFDETVTVTVPTSTIPAIYKGTITQTVS